MLLRRNKRRYSGTLGARPIFPTHSWRFDESLAQTINPYVGANDITAQAPASNVKAPNKFGVQDGALRFSSTNMATTTPSIYSGTGPLTMHFRVRPTALQTLTLICRRDGNNDGQLLGGFTPKNGKLTFNFWIGDRNGGSGIAPNTGIEPTTLFDVGDWVDVVFTRNAGKLEAYLNGKLAESGNVGNYNVNAAAWYFFNDGRDRNSQFIGDVSDINIWNDRVLNAGEIAYLANTPELKFGIRENEPMLLLHMDSVITNDTVFVDSSPRNRKLTSFGFFQHPTYKKYGLSGAGQGTGTGYLEVTNSDGINLDGEFSIDLDYMPQEGSNISIFGKSGAGGNWDSALFQRYSDGRFYLYDDAGVHLIPVGIPTGGVVGVWQHITIRRNAANVMEFLIDNVVKWSGTVVGRFFSEGNTNKLRIGWNGHNRLLTSGIIDEFRIIKKYTKPSTLPTGPY